MGLFFCGLPGLESSQGCRDRILASCHTWFGFGKFPLKKSKLTIFSFWAKKNIFGPGQKVPGSKVGQLLIYCESKVSSSRVGSVPISSSIPSHDSNFFRPGLQKYQQGTLSQGNNILICSNHRLLWLGSCTVCTAQDNYNYYLKRCLSQISYGWSLQHLFQYEMIPSLI